MSKGKEKYCYDYPRPAVTTDVVALAKNDKISPKVLLIERRNPPFQYMWALPGGFVDMDEDIETTAARELEEETGLNGVTLKQICAFGNVERDPRYRTITIAYLACLDEEVLAKGGDDAVEAKWFSVSDLPALAFDHADIIEKGLEVLRNEQL
jgi:8-oxo-dGTP diphosphatase